VIAWLRREVDDPPESGEPGASLGLPVIGGAYNLSPTEYRVAGLSAVRRAMSVIAGSLAFVAAQPDGWQEWRGSSTPLPPSRIVNRPSTLWTRREWAYRIVATMMLYDRAYVWHVGRDSEGVPLELIPVPPSAIRTHGNTDPFGMLPPLAYQIAGRPPVSAADVTVIRSALLPSMPDSLAGVLAIARESLSAALAAETYAARYWQAGGSPTVQITTDQVLKNDQAADLATRWRERRALGPDYPSVLGAGAKAEPFGADPLQQAAVEARRELVADLARYFGIPTRLMNAPAGDSETYANVQSEGQEMVLYTVGNYSAAIDDAVSDLLPGLRRMSTDLGIYTRGTALERAQTWALATGNTAWMATDEVREVEDLPPRELPQPAANVSVTVGEEA
jgi:phage portal protein BeeE